MQFLVPHTISQKFSMMSSGVTTTSCTSSMTSSSVATLRQVIMMSWYSWCDLWSLQLVSSHLRWLDTCVIFAEGLPVSESKVYSGWECTECHYSHDITLYHTMERVVRGVVLTAKQWSMNLHSSSGGACKTFFCMCLNFLLYVSSSLCSFLLEKEFVAPSPLASLATSSRYAVHSSTELAPIPASIPADVMWLLTGLKFCYCTLTSLRPWEMLQ